MSFYYLATPYSKYPGGIEKAYQLACEQAAFLLWHKVPVFCPIAHSHGIAKHGAIDPFSHEFWLPADRPFMDLAKGLIVVMAEGWSESVGIAAEIAVFMRSSRRIVMMRPGVLPAGLL